MKDNQVCCSAMAGYLVYGYVFVAEDNHYYVNAIGDYENKIQIELIKCPNCGKKLPLEKDDE